MKKFKNLLVYNDVRYKLNLLKYNIKFGIISLNIEKKVKKNCMDEVLLSRIQLLDKKSKNLILTYNENNSNKSFVSKLIKRHIIVKKGSLNKNAEIYIANHQNVFEFFVLSKIFKDIPLRTVIKRELKNFKFSKGFCYYDIDINRDDPQSTIKLFKEIKKSIKQDYKILIFPEGTRNRTNKPLLPFKENLGKLLTKLNVKVQGIAIKNLKEFMRGQERNIEIYFTELYNTNENNWYNNIYNEMYNYLKK